MGQSWTRGYVPHPLCYLELRISQFGIVGEAYLKSQGKRECQEGGIVKRVEDSELGSEARK